MGAQSVLLPPPFLAAAVAIYKLDGRTYCAIVVVARALETRLLARVQQQLNCAKECVVKALRTIIIIVIIIHRRGS